MKVTGGKGFGTLCWEDNYDSFHKVGWSSGHKLLLTSEVEEYNFVLQREPPIGPEAFGFATGLILSFIGEFEEN